MGWEEISLLPRLNPQERKLAKDMRTLARLKLYQVRKWQQQLDHLSITLDVPTPMNVVPSSERPWLNWVANQFSIKPSLSAEEKEQQQLRNALMHIRQNMNLERWPEDNAWQQLRSRLHLQISKSMTETEINENTQDNVLKLPESFSIIDSDILQLRQSAKQWLEAL